MIMTAICWTLGTRPTKVPVRQVHMTPELAKAVEMATNMIHSDQILVFLGMAGLMNIVKRIVKSPFWNDEYRDFREYLINRWQDVCSTTEIENIFTSGVVLRDRVTTFIDTLKIWQVWIKSRPALSRNLLVAALDLPERSPMLVKTAMAKVKIEIQYFGMEMILKMDAFVSSQHINVNKAIFVPDIAQQAADLRKAIDELRIRYGDRFPYLKIYRLEGTDRLNYKKYPDLFYAVIATGVANNRISLDSVRHILIDLQTRTDRHIIDAEVKKTLKSEILDEVTIANLRCLNIEPRLFCQRREENDYENEMLSIEEPKD
ncbi:Nucleocapsid [Temnothorax longispinosus]|uniref:Nucleocapsid n=2 Tax=Temnothorax longispinosus TaxID=300112 RepID=A0A4S2JVD2_9HYME|nr:Nucleocapsid [Temnothorax longispinosus]